MNIIDNLIEQLKITGNDLEGEVKFPMLGNNVLFTIGLSETSEIEPSHRESITWLYNNIANVFPLVEQAVFEYYQSVLPDYHLGLGDYADKLMPHIKEPSDVWCYVTDPGVFVFPEAEGGEIHIEFECTFDAEHGLRVVFKEENLLRVGLM
ncbi:DUF6985 domain-containing protein [Vibrio campbellii]|uniref:DUF6985 domain-containing protein n=1 Tax=Vibrio campbellii TaxID=680 RepID=UPI00142D8784|nr:hypothetical protein [Vibrio campbellii]NIY87371.1 hypothetical protein [Vibrio campbellii]NVK71454.1 hypothetical protein [Vibrio campbellii]